MNNKKKYSHEQYRDILSKAHKANSELNEYFCPKCRRFVPKEMAMILVSFAKVQIGA